MNERFEDPATPDVPSFLTGSETGERIRTFDWSATSLGPIASWPRSLRTVVSAVQASGFPMIALWGPDLVQIYNDGYRCIMGSKHPSGLGQPTRECWPEVWHINEPIYADVLAGKSSMFEDALYPINREGVREDAWFTLSYGPIRDDADAVAGILVTVVETTKRMLAERRLAAETARTRKLFEQAPGFIAISRGPEHVYEFGNEAYARLVGRRDFVGKTVRDALPEIEGQGFYELLDGVFATGTAHVAKGVPVRMRRTPGGALEERFVDFIYEAVTDEAGRVTGIFTQGHDVTDAHLAQEVLRENEAFTRQILESSTDCIKVLDLDANLLFMSEGGKRVMEVADFGTIAGCPWTDFWHDEGNVEAKAAVEAARSGGEGSFQGQAYTMAGNLRHWDVHVTPILDLAGRPERLLSIARDVTDQKVAESQRADLANELSHRMKNTLAMVQAIVTLWHCTSWRRTRPSTGRCRMQMGVWRSNGLCRRKELSRSLGPRAEDLPSRRRPGSASAPVSWSGSSRPTSTERRRSRSIRPASGFGSTDRSGRRKRDRAE